jgi:hypothetical protein
MPLNELDRRYIIAKHRAVKLVDRELKKLNDDELYDLEMVKDDEGQPVALDVFAQRLAAGASSSQPVDGSTELGPDDQRKPVKQEVTLPIEPVTEENYNPFQIAALAREALVGKTEIKVPYVPQRA